LSSFVQRLGQTAGALPLHAGLYRQPRGAPVYAEAWRALEEQVAAPEVIDAALRDGGGFPMGPLALTDLIGQDVNFAVTCSVFNAFWQDRRFLPSLLQQELAWRGVWARRADTASIAGLLKYRLIWLLQRYSLKMQQKTLNVTLSLNWMMCCCWKPLVKPRWL
jgi:3-hydroxyacyl-CoA dehydrogenase